MSQYNPKKIEELQMVLLKNPRSPVFASLAEHYRKMGLLEEALEVTTRGVKHNPEYVSGLVAHAMTLYELKNFREAIKILSKAHALKPENILALKLLGHSHLKLRQHQEALRVFKKLLIIKPDDEGAMEMVSKWEFLDNLPPEGRSGKLQVDGYENWVQKLPSETHALHLIDSFMNYGDQDTALEIANSARLYWPHSSALQKRQDLLLQSQSESDGPPLDDDSETKESSFNPALDFLRQKKAFYEKWLQRIEQMKSIDR